jgi:hypothetical protein
MFSREKAKASIHFKNDPVGLCPYSVILRDGESNACEFGAFSNYDSARYFATTNAANIEFDCGRDNRNIAPAPFYACTMCGNVLDDSETFCPAHPNAQIHSIRPEGKPETVAKFVVLINQSSTSVSLRAHFGYFKNSDVELLSQITDQREAWIADQFDAGHFSDYWALTITERRTDGSVHTFDGDELRAVFNAALKFADTATHQDMPNGV